MCFDVKDDKIIIYCVNKNAKKNLTSFFRVITNGYYTKCLPGLKTKPTNFANQGQNHSFIV
jgi:hypothetical protein